MRHPPVPNSRRKSTVADRQRDQRNETVGIMNRLVGCRAGVNGREGTVISNGSTFRFQTVPRRPRIAAIAAIALLFLTVAVYAVITIHVLVPGSKTLNDDTILVMPSESNELGKFNKVSRVSSSVRKIKATPQENKTNARSLKDKKDSLSIEKNGMVRISFNSSDAVSSGSKQAVLLRGWGNPTYWTERRFLNRVGHFQQYLKDTTVQPITDSEENKPCILPGTAIAELMRTRSDKELLFFTNNKENKDFMKELDNDYTVPDYLKHIDGFGVFSAMAQGMSHPFHKHGESWIGQVEGRKVWWFLPPTANKPGKTNACDYLNKTKPPEGAVSCIQEPGDIIWFPNNWYHATCALDDWTVAIGKQRGRLIRQLFASLDQSNQNWTQAEITIRANECLGSPPAS